MSSIQDLRNEMVDRQIARRGVSSVRVLDAMRRVPREMFVPDSLAEFAYEDTPLPIGEEQTISQPLMVALMTEALQLEGGERVLEVGAGSGYAAAVLAEIADRVVTIERHESLAQQARKRLERQDYDNVQVVVGDGSQGYAEAAPYDAIVVAAGGRQVPKSLLRQLKIGGRLLIPLGAASQTQTLTRFIRKAEDDYEEEDLGPVRFVPLVGEEGWAEERPSTNPSESLGYRIAFDSERLDDIEAASLEGLLDRIGDARVVLIGEASHGTSEFYRMRARITRELIQRKGFRIVAAEADWPDARRIDAWVRHRREQPREWTAFARFPTWMWRNEETREFVDWLREFNAALPDAERCGFYGLDLYSLRTSIDAVLDYLDEVDPAAASVARERYGCLSPWEEAPEAYAWAAATEAFDRCREPVGAMLRDLLELRLEEEAIDGQLLFDAQQNARLIANAERYYRSMYDGAAESWNLRDSHMFETLELLLKHVGTDARAVVWAHNSHIGDAAATQMSARGEHNIGQLCRETYGDGSYHVGFGTHTGTVAAASRWDAPLEIKTVRPSHAGSYERQCHESAVPAFMLPLRHARRDLRDALARPRLERAIGVIYRPERELESHYFQAVLPAQFDEYIWFDRTSAVKPLGTLPRPGVPETYPFGT